MHVTNHSQTSMTLSHFCDTNASDPKTCVKQALTSLDFHSTALSTGVRGL